MDTRRLSSLSHRCEGIEQDAQARMNVLLGASGVVDALRAAYADEHDSMHVCIGLLRAVIIQTRSLRGLTPATMQECLAVLVQESFADVSATGSTDRTETAVASLGAGVMEGRTELATRRARSFEAEQEEAALQEGLVDRAAAAVEGFAREMSALWRRDPTLAQALGFLALIKACTLKLEEMGPVGKVVAVTAVAEATQHLIEQERRSLQVAGTHAAQMLSRISSSSAGRGRHKG